jgi:hypothetical protein
LLFHGAPDHRSRDRVLAGDLAPMFNFAGSGVIS